MSDVPEFKNVNTHRKCFSFFFFVFFISLLSCPFLFFLFLILNIIPLWTHTHTHTLSLSHIHSLSLSSTWCNSNMFNFQLTCASQTRRAPARDPSWSWRKTWTLRKASKLLQICPVGENFKKNGCVCVCDWGGFFPFQKTKRNNKDDVMR